MRHAPHFDHVGSIACCLAAALAGACTTATSHAPDAGAGGQVVVTSTGGRSGGAGAGGGATGAGGGGGSGAAGHPVDAGGDASGAAGTTGAASCASLALCDTFEAQAANGPPSSALWTIIPPSPQGTATIDTIGAHGSAHSLKVVSTGRIYLRNSSVIGTLGPVVHARFYVRFMSALSAGHGAMVVTHPSDVGLYTPAPELRFGSQDSVFHWNTDSDQANIPDTSPNGDAASFAPAANTWYCVELTINTNGHLNVSIDGNDISGLAEDGVPTPDIDQAWISGGASLTRYATLFDFNVGWQSFGSGDMTLWFDDVALSASPIGCQN